MRQDWSQALKKRNLSTSKLRNEWNPKSGWVFLPEGQRFHEQGTYHTPAGPLNASEKILSQVVGGQGHNQFPRSKGLLVITNQRLIVVTMSVLGTEPAINYFGEETNFVRLKKWDDLPLPYVHEWRLGQMPADLVGTKNPVTHQGWITSIREVGPPKHWFTNKPERKRAFLIIWTTQQDWLNSGTAAGRPHDETGMPNFWVLCDDPRLQEFLNAFRGVLKE